MRARHTFGCGGGGFRARAGEDTTPPWFSFKPLLARSLAPGVDGNIFTRPPGAAFEPSAWTLYGVWRGCGGDLENGQKIARAGERAKDPRMHKTHACEAGGGGWRTTPAIPGKYPFLQVGGRTWHSGWIVSSKQRLIRSPRLQFFQSCAPPVSRQDEDGLPPEYLPRGLHRVLPATCVSTNSCKAHPNWVFFRFSADHASIGSSIFLRLRPVCTCW